MRKGKVSSQTIGNKTKAMRASGQHNKKRMHHSKKAAIEIHSLRGRDAHTLSQYFGYVSVLFTYEVTSDGGQKFREQQISEDEIF